MKIFDILGIIFYILRLKGIDPFWNYFWYVVSHSRWVHENGCHSFDTYLPFIFPFVCVCMLGSACAGTQIFLRSYCCFEAMDGFGVEELLP